MRQQPNSKYCFVCGVDNQVGLSLHFFDNDTGEVRALYTVDSRYNGYPGVVHGGIVAAMLDEAGGRAAMVGNPDRFMMTATLDIRYRKPVPVETPLLLIGRIIRDRGRTAQAHSELRLPDGTVAAEAEMTLVAIPDELSQRGEALAALGWQVYPYDGPIPPSE